MEGFYFHRKIFNQTRLKKFYQKRSSCENFLSIKNPVAIVRKPPWLKHLFSKMASVESISGILLKKDSTNNYSNLQVAVQVATENDELNADADADADAEANISADAEMPMPRFPDCFVKYNIL